MYCHFSSKCIDIFSSPEPLGAPEELIACIPTHSPSSVVVVHNVQTSSLKPLGQSKPNFMWSILRKRVDHDLFHDKVNFGHNFGHKLFNGKLEDHWSCSSPERLSHCKLMRFTAPFTRVCRLSILHHTRRPCVRRSEFLFMLSSKTSGLIDLLV